MDDIDLYLGGFLEAAHEDSILGPVFKCIIGDQFARLKKGDKFFYDLGLSQQRAFTLGQLEEIRKTSMARIICDNTDDVDRIQPLAFKMPNSRYIPYLAKLYYTSFWDKFGMNVNYFGMHPKT